MTGKLEDALKEWHGKYSDWLQSAALPLWWEQGADHVKGGFHELLGPDGKPVIVPRRARVQGRQSYSYAVAGLLGWNGPVAQAALHGIEYLEKHYKAANGLYATLVSEDGKIADTREMIYDQAFALTASAAIYQALPEKKDAMASYARALFASLDVRKHAAGGYKETGDLYLSNPHMHMFEALMAWYEADGDQKWFDAAGDIARLSLTRFIDANTLTLHEHFDAEWNVAEGEKGCILEPGHQFEWTWLLARWSKMSGRMDAHLMARRLFEVGSSGVDKLRNVAVDEMDDSFSFTRPTARLWMQTERLKAALILSDADSTDERNYYLGEAVLAAESLWRYLDTPVPGLWRDKMIGDGTSFIEEASPASSFYHIICAIQYLGKAVK